MYMCVCVRACVHACVRTCVHVCMRACVRACMRVCTTAQLHDNACIQCMRDCFRKRPHARPITQRKLQYYGQPPQPPLPPPPQHKLQACIQYMYHCFRKKTTTTAITQCKLQYYGQPPLPPPPPQHKVTEVKNYTTTTAQSYRGQKLHHHH